MLKGTSWRLAVVASVLGALASAGASADTPLACDVLTAGECQITTLHDLGAGGSFSVDRNLHIIGPKGELRVNAGATLDLFAEALTIDSRGKIAGDAQTADGIATLNINVDFDSLLETGATISAAITAVQCNGVAAASSISTGFLA
jgi:hypothetical protein